MLRPTPHRIALIYNYPQSLFLTTRVVHAPFFHKFGCDLFFSTLFIAKISINYIISFSKLLNCSIVNCGSLSVQVIKCGLLTWNTHKSKVFFPIIFRFDISAKYHKRISKKTQLAQSRNVQHYHSNINRLNNRQKQKKSCIESSILWHMFVYRYNLLSLNQ